MRDYAGIDYASIRRDDELMPNRIRNMLGTIDYYLRDVSFGMSRIQKGQVPDGSGNSIPGALDGTQFFFLPGRSGGQTASQADQSAPILDFDVAAFGTSTIGQTGNTFIQFSWASNKLAALRTYKFDNSTNDIAFVPLDTGPGPGFYFGAADSTSAARILATANRAFFQVGAKNSSNQTVAPNFTLGGIGATCGTSENHEMQRITFRNTSTTAELGSTVSAGITKIGMNVSPDDYTGGTWVDTLVVAARNAAASTVPQISAVVPTTVDGLGIAIRQAPGGASPNQTLGSILAALSVSHGNTGYGQLALYETGTVRAKVALTNQAGTGTFTISDGSDQIMHVSRFVGAWSDNATIAQSMQHLIGQTMSSGSDLNKRYAVVNGSGSNPFDRYGICTVAMVIGNRGAAALPAPAANRLLTLDNGTGSVALDVSALSAARTLTWPDASGTLPLLERTQTWTGTQTFDANSGGSGAIPIITSANLGGDTILEVLDAGNAANNVQITMASMSGATTLQLPASGTVVTTTVAAAMTNKTINDGSVNLPPSNYGSIGTTTIALGTSPVGVYAIEVVAICTTASGAGAPTLDVTIGYTDTLGATTTNVAASSGTAFPLPLSATGRASGRVALRRASGNITYATTVNAAAGTPQYALYIRVLGLGA